MINRLAAGLLASMILCQAAEKPLEIKVVVVSLFERGADTGDAPGEFQSWVEREKLDRVLPFPAGNRDIRVNKDGVLGICAGIGTARAAASISGGAMESARSSRLRPSARSPWRYQ